MGWRNIKRFLDDTAGGTLLYVGLMLAALTGFAGLGIDVGHWYSTQRAAQSAADSAAIAGSFESMWGGDAAAIETAAKAQATLNGFDATLVTVNNPPASGPSSADAKAVEVIIQAPKSGFFSSIFYQEGPVDITARSVAAQVPGSPACVVSLKTSGTAIDLNSGSEIEANGCMVHANSSSGSAIKTNSGSSVTAESISVVGGTSGSGYSPSPETGADTMADPLGYLRPPANASAPCDYSSTDYKTDQTIYPGVYCGDHVVDDGATVTLSGGTYVFKGSKFEVNSGSTIETNPGDGVTLYFASSMLFTLNSGSTAQLEAPATGDYAGVLIYSESNQDHLINSGSSSFFEGVIYIPNGKVMVNSGSTIGSTANFSAFVVNELELNSGSTLVMNSDYATSSVPSVPTLGARRIALFE